jgi:cytochrome c oxidase cbb3-type subunit 2
MQFIRPVNDEHLRWGPVSRAGESAFDVPHFFGTRRIGPDLAREGLLRNDDWHIAHLWDPRTVVKGSVMPAFPWLFHEQEHAERIRHLISVLDTNGDGIVSGKLGDDTSNPTEEIARLRDEAALPQYDQWGVDSVARIGDPGGDPTRWAWAQSGDGLLTDHDARPLPRQPALDLVAYLQRLGTTIGPWRRPVHAGAAARVSPFETAEGVSLMPPRRPREANVHGFLRGIPERLKAAEAAYDGWRAEMDAWEEANPLLAERLARGRELYQQHCAACHGDEGRGNGLGAPHLQIRPRDFTIGKYKWRSTVIGNLPTDGDLFRTIVRGLPGTAMPSWRELPEERVWLLVDYVKTFYEGDKPWNDMAEVVPIPPERFDPNPEKELARGRAVYFAAGALCYNCHGREGAADGPAWNTTAGDYGGVVRPRDLVPRWEGDQVELRLRAGATAQDIYRTIMTGIDGTPMVAQFNTFFRKNYVRIPFRGGGRSERAVRIESLASRVGSDGKPDPNRRLKLSIALGEQALYDVGVEKVTNAQGEVEEYLTLEEGDDWALVHYVMSLGKIPIRRPAAPSE